MEENARQEIIRRDEEGLHDNMNRRKEGRKEGKRGGRKEGKKQEQKDKEESVYIPKSILKYKQEEE